jgi:hypothetical protein
MKSVAAILVLVSAGALLAAKELLRDKRECAVWWVAFLIITFVGLAWAKEYEAFLPKGERERLRRSGFIDGVTSGMSPMKTKPFCMALGTWLLCLGLRLLWRIYG